MYILCCKAKFFFITVFFFISELKTKMFNNKMHVLNVHFPGKLISSTIWNLVISMTEHNQKRQVC